ncbi:MAG: alpha/beta fold hydrolase [Candidatus Cryptobacteroides sp.]
MKTAIETIKSVSDGLTIKVLSVLPEREAPKAVLQIVHGMCEHKERYVPFMEYMASEGYACVIHDHRGHGETVHSADDLGYFYKGGFRAAVDDALEVTRYTKKRFPGIPFFLFGHSMGSMIVRSYAKRYDSELSGLIVCGSPSENPAAGLGKVLASVVGFFGGGRCRPALLQKIAFGAFNRGIDRPHSPNAWICTDEEVVRTYDNDPLCNFRFTANGFRNLFALMQDCYSPDGWRMASPSMPVLFIAGEEDPCIAGLEKFGKAVDSMRKAGYTCVSSRTYPGMRHEILNEKDKATVWQDVLEWLDSVLA